MVHMCTYLYQEEMLGSRVYIYNMNIGYTCVYTLLNVPLAI